MQLFLVGILTVPHLVSGFGRHFRLSVIIGFGIAFVHFLRVGQWPRSNAIASPFDSPGEPIFTKFCTLVRVPDVFLSFEFQKGWKNVGAVGVEISFLPLKRHIAYTTTPCSKKQAPKLLAVTLSKLNRFLKFFH